MSNQTVTYFKLLLCGMLLVVLGCKVQEDSANLADDGSATIKQHEVYLEGDAPNGYGRLRENGLVRAEVSVEAEA